MRSVAAGHIPGLSRSIADLVYVANQHAGNITVLRINELTGDLTETGSRIVTPTPAHVLGPPGAGGTVTDYRIVRLQIQRSPVKVGKAPLRRYDPAVILPVSSIVAGPQGVRGIADDGELFLDVHHQLHPQSRDRKGSAGVLFMGTGDYAALRERYGDHVTDGIAAETMLLDAPEGLAGRDLPTSVTITTAGGPMTLLRVRVADPCVEFSRFCLRQEISPTVDDAVKQTLKDLDGGARGYRSVAAAAATITVGDILTM